MRERCKVHKWAPYRATRFKGLPAQICQFCLAVKMKNYPEFFSLEEVLKDLGWSEDIWELQVWNRKYKGKRKKFKQTGITSIK